MGNYISPIVRILRPRGARAARVRARRNFAALSPGLLPRGARAATTEVMGLKFSVRTHGELPTSFSGLTLVRAPVLVGE